MALGPLRPFPGLSSANQKRPPPNIVAILSDDQGYADVSFNPDHPADVETPHIDALAREGVSFSQAYISASVCSPSRAGLMLGRYQNRVGVYDSTDAGAGFNPETKIFPAFLPDAYTSSALGKWHLGIDKDYPQLRYHALNRGFDECYKFMGRGGHDYFNTSVAVRGPYSPMYRNKERVLNEEWPSGYLTTQLTEEAVAFIGRQKRTPFFLYLAYNAVHSPLQAPEADVAWVRKKFPQRNSKIETKKKSELKKRGQTEREAHDLRGDALPPGPRGGVGCGKVQS